MSDQDAINLFNQWRSLTRVLDEEIAVYDMAITALEKQIPYKLEPCHPYEGKCKCGAMFLDRHTDYCGNCGQKLDWEEN